MTTARFLRAAAGALGLALALTLAAAGCAQTPTDPAQAARLQSLRTSGRKAALTLYPIQVRGKPSREVADVLGLLLEKYGMEQLEAVDTPFSPPADTPWEQMPARFGEFLAQQPPASDYVLYAEYLGEPKTGPTEVRFLVADAAGNLVLSDRQTRADTDFRRTAARHPDPMGCSVLVAERLFSQLGWHKSRGAAEGKFARLWAEKSGTPSAAERSAMKKRADELKAALAGARISVYATLVSNAPDTGSAARLAGLIQERLGCQTSVAQTPVPIKLQPTSNEQKRLWDLARAFREHLRTTPPEAGYALMAEYYVDPSGGPAGAVHLVLCDVSGQWVIVDFQNNHHEDFQRAAPRTVEDCDALAVQRLGRYLR
jgi:hypothetical protein